VIDSSVDRFATGGVMNSDKEKRTSAKRENAFVMSFVVNTSS
jgi:hypothetical protein